MAGRHEIFLKREQDKNGNDYYTGWSKQTGTVTVFLWSEGEKGYSGKLYMSSRVRRRTTRFMRSSMRWTGFGGNPRAKQSFNRWSYRR